MPEEYSDRGVAEGSRVEVGEDSIEVKLKQGSPLHSKLISRLIARRKLSERTMSRRYDAWNMVDENCRMFIDLSRQARNADGSTQSDKKEIPWARSIVVPMSYAILQVFLTQEMGIFTRRDPPLEVTGTGPEDVRPAKLMNAVLAYDQVQTNYVLELYTALQDSFKYGMGGFADCWEQCYGWKTERMSGLAKKVLEFLGRETSQRVWTLKKSYNKVEAWDPFSTFPDPRVSLSKIDRGEFFGYRVWLGYLEILAGSQDNGGNFFNTDKVPRSSPKPQNLRSRNRFQSSQMNLIGSMDERDKGFHAVDSFVVRIIPKEWELSTEERPEKWQFTWVDDQVIIRAHRMDYDHDEYPFSGFESNIDTHVFCNQGSIENLEGLQRFMNWKYNSHVQNIIRHLNNRMIYDPALIEAFDVNNPDAAMHIRLTALGSQMLRSGTMTLPGMIKQIELADVTGDMLKDIAFDLDMAMRMSGAADQMMGRLTQQRRTLGEVQRVGHEGSSRMAMHAIMMDIQGIRPLALRWCSNRQQYTEEEMYVRIAGDLAAEFGGDRVSVKPGDLYGNYDYLPKTGPEPPDPGQMFELMFNGLKAIPPEVMVVPDKNGKILDPHEFIKEGLRDRGVKNPNDFYREMGGQPGQQPPGTNVQVLPDEEVMRQKQAGNIVPIRGAA